MKDTPRPTRPGIGNGLRWSELEADINRSRRDIGIWPRANPIPVDDTIARVDAVINDLDTNHPDSAQVAADMRAAIATTPTEIVTVDGPLSAEEAEAIRDLVTAQLAELRAHIAQFVPPNPDEFTPITPDAYQLERARHMEERHVELCGCTWDHPANAQPAQPGWIRRTIRRWTHR